MKVFQALQIQHVLDGRAIPSDMMDEHLVYYSESKDRFIRIVDMDVAHLVRAFNKLYQPNEYDEPVSDEMVIQENEELKQQSLKDKQTIAKIRKLLHGEDNTI